MIRKNTHTHTEEDWLLMTIRCHKLAYFVHIKIQNSLKKIIIEGQVPEKEGDRTTMATMDKGYCGPPTRR